LTEEEHSLAQEEVLLDEKIRHEHSESVDEEASRAL
jgi:hypothetical protein